MTKQRALFYLLLCVNDQKILLRDYRLNESNSSRLAWIQLVLYYCCVSVVCLSLQVLGLLVTYFILVVQFGTPFDCSTAISAALATTNNSCATAAQ